MESAGLFFVCQVWRNCYEVEVLCRPCYREVLGEGNCDVVRHGGEEAGHYREIGLREETTNGHE
jgi:hypothetical protein